MTTTHDTRAATPRGPLRLPLIAALALAFVSLALISGAAYIAVLTGATSTTERLLVDRAGRVVDAQIAMVRSRLDPVTEQLEMMAALIAADRIDINSPVAVREALAVMVSKTPAMSIAGLGTLDGQLHRAIRQPDGSIVRDTVPLVSLERERSFERFRDMQLSHKTFWGALFWSSSQQQPVLNVRTPVRRIDDAFIGGLAATVAIGDFSSLIGDPSQPGGGHFYILVGPHHDHVVAHPRLVDPRGLGLTEDRPLPTIREVGDPVLAHIWDKPAGTGPIQLAFGKVGHVVEVNGERWIFVHRELTGYGPDPWLVGQYLPLSEAAVGLDRLTNGALVGAATLAAALLLSLLMGFRMARSIRTITSAAEAIERLDFEQPMHRRSRLREIDDAAHSLEKARGALKWFGAYVPQRLVRRLMEVGEDGVASRRTHLTVMFTDIVEFTPQAEHLPEQETAALLNHHFALLGACIEREHGIIDKYIGDSVMAIWGAASGSPDHAADAIRAALAIARVIHEDNEQRRLRGEAPIRVRVGVHSGVAVVGNIGAPGRINFTVVGDTVNVAQRFEQLGKEFMKPGEDVVVLVSGDTLRAAKDLPSLGIDPLPKPELRAVKGHEQPVEVYRLA